MKSVVQQLDVTLALNTIADYPDYTVGLDEEKAKESI